LGLTNSTPIEAEPRTMSVIVHKRFLDYRDLHVYFGEKKPSLPFVEFQKLDAEYHSLMKKERDDEEEARLEELAQTLHRN
jgi:hypothetical protein